MLNEIAATQMLADYYRAFSTLDVRAILPYFQEPALIMAPAGAVAVPNSATLDVILTRVMEDLKARGYERSEFNLQQFQVLSDKTVVVNGIAVRYKTNAEELERVRITYLLQQADTWKIAVMVLHDA